MDTVEKNESRIAEYIAHQLKEDMLGEQLTINNAGAVHGRQVTVSTQLAVRIDAFTHSEEPRAMPACEKPPAWRVVVYCLG